MDLHLYTRGGPRAADHRFVGPGTPDWWGRDLAFWLSTERPTLVARQADGRFEVALCGLPTSRRVVDGTAISNLLVLAAKPGSDDARAVLGAALDWLTGLTGDLDGSAVARLVDKTITAELVDANLGIQSAATDRALTDVANDLIGSYGDFDDADASLDESVAEDSGGWLGSIGSEAARQAFSATLAALATGDGPDGFVAAHLNRARAEADGRAAAKRLPGPGALLLLGDALSGVVRLAPKAPGADPARQEATRSPWPRLKVTLVAVAAVGILAALALAAWALRRWLLL